MSSRDAVKGYIRKEDGLCADFDEDPTWAWVWTRRRATEAGRGKRVTEDRKSSTWWHHLRDQPRRQAQMPEPDCWSLRQDALEGSDRHPNRGPSRLESNDDVQWTPPIRPRRPRSRMMTFMKYMQWKHFNGKLFYWSRDQLWCTALRQIRSIRSHFEAPVKRKSAFKQINIRASSLAPWTWCSGLLQIRRWQESRRVQATLEVGGYVEWNVLLCSNVVSFLPTYFPFPITDADSVVDRTALLCWFGWVSCGWNGHHSSGRLGVVLLAPTGPGFPTRAILVIRTPSWQCKGRTIKVDKDPEALRSTVSDQVAQRMK